MTIMQFVKSKYILFIYFQLSKLESFLTFQRFTNKMKQILRKCQRKPLKKDDNVIFSRKKKKSCPSNVFLR